MEKEVAVGEWDEFCKYLAQENRYFLISKWKVFVDEIITWAEKRKIIHRKGTRLWRARVDPENKVDEKSGRAIPLDDIAMGAPTHDKAREGRANPQGIPYLYLACEESTAIWEVKPYLGKFVTLATFELVKDVHVINTLGNSSWLKFLFDIGDKKELSLDDREKLIWYFIDTYFSIPISPEDNHCDYIPTQFLSELFKNNGYDGVQYRSSLKHDGCNVVLFDTKAAIIQNKCVWKADKILYDLRQVAT